MKFVSWSVRFLTMILVVFVLISAQEPPPPVATTTSTTTPKEECVVGDDGTCVDQEQVQATNPQEEIVDKNCPDRGHIIRCTGETLDLNKNGKLDRVELDTAIASLPWFARGIVTLLGNTDKMMKKCDIDHDDAISMDYDMLHNQDTCLATCFKRKAFKQTFFPDCKL